MSEHSASLNVVKNLQAGRALIAERYIKGTYAEDERGEPVGPLSPGAYCFCSLGALCKVTGYTPADVDSIQERQLLGRGAGAVSQWSVESGVGLSITYVNDKLGKDATLEMWDKAIELALDRHFEEWLVDKDEVCGEGRELYGRLSLRQAWDQSTNGAHLAWWLFNGLKRWEPHTLYSETNPEGFQFNYSDMGVKEPELRVFAAWIREHFNFDGTRRLAPQGENR